MKDCSIDAKINLSDSIIANGSQIDNHHTPKKYQFLLGERSQLKL
jgi:hypothetical protein